MVYGDAESILGEFLRGRRERWIVASKYSGQNREHATPVAATVEQQLQRLGVETIDFYQLHWAARGDERALYDELARLKEAGKIRFAGVSLKSAGDIDYIIARGDIDGIQLPVSLLDPQPLIARLAALRASGLAVIARSSLKEGFLTGKYRRDARFTDPLDQRSSWGPERVATTVDQVERFRFLESAAGSMLRAAAAWPLGFDVVSTVILGTKSTAYADGNFGAVPGFRLPAAALRQIVETQAQMGLLDVDEGGWSKRLRGLVAG
jgi:aryl-alcohol dehydrogenase-like predicted oxidoreductase